MNKKTKVKLELEEAVKREATAQDCPEPSCKQHFWSPISRESHKALYPSHFAKKQISAPVKKEAAIVETLKGTIKRGKREHKNI